HRRGAFLIELVTMPHLIDALLDNRRLLTDADNSSLVWEALKTSPDLARLLSHNGLLKTLQRLKKITSVLVGHRINLDDVDPATLNGVLRNAPLLSFLHDISRDDANFIRRFISTGIWQKQARDDHYFLEKFRQAYNQAGSDSSTNAIKTDATEVFSV